MSKLSGDTIRDSIQCESQIIHTHSAQDLAAVTCLRLKFAGLPAAIVEASQAKPRKFTETIELQIRLKNYDPQKDKRFSGTVKLPYMPRPQMKVCCLSAVVALWFQPPGVLSVSPRPAIQPLWVPGRLVQHRTAVAQGGGQLPG